MAKDPQKIDQSTLYDANQAGKWPGTQKDGQYENTSDLRPQYPPCSGPETNQYQFAESLPNTDFRGDNYIQARFDGDNQVLPERRPFDHDAGAVGDAGQFGNLLFADSDLSGDARFAQNNVIEYGTGPRFAQNSVVIVSNDRADRGRES